MAEEPKCQELIRLLTVAKRMERAARNEYTHAVQVLAPISLLERMDLLLKRNSRLTRPIIVRRALTTYLMAMERTGNLNLRHKPRRRIAQKKTQ